VILRRFVELTVSPWRNKAGRKADLFAGPGWMAGFAFLDADAAFSDYGGWDRTITLVEGAGFSLAGEGRRLEARLREPLGFDGGWRCGCVLAGGPCLVLNAMTERGRWTHRVTVGPAVPGSGERAVVVVLDGHIGAAGRHDALLLEGEAMPAASADAVVWRAEYRAG
jgi:environmental stress-induced protein Ves